jgi:predicted RNA-binding protein YlxR (DUF448 family)/ribosomal protein L7Ae-like RNA K-turn-binding protein
MTPTMTDRSAQPASMPRTCAGCGMQAEKLHLLRWVRAWDDAQVVLDIGYRLPGRAVSTHASRACIQAAARRGSLGRALRRKGQAGPRVVETHAGAGMGASTTLDATSMVELARQQLAMRIESMLYRGWRAHHVVVGTDAVFEALGEHGRAYVFVAKDVSARTLHAVTEALTPHGPKPVVFASKQRLGALFGRDEVGVLAVVEPGLISAIRLRCDQLIALGDGNRESLSDPPYARPEGSKHEC